MEYGAPEGKTPEYDGAGGGVPESGGAAGYDGAQARSPYSKNAPGDIGYGREWSGEPPAQIAADSNAHSYRQESVSDVRTGCQLIKARLGIAGLLQETTSLFR